MDTTVPNTFDVIAMPREKWDMLMAKIDNLASLTESRLRAEYENEFVDIDGARKILQYGTKKIEQFRKAGLPYYQWEPGGKIFYRRADLLAWVEQCRKVDSKQSDPIDLNIEQDMERLPFEQ